jgi:hypothetical protein
VSFSLTPQARNKLPPWVRAAGGQGFGPNFGPKLKNTAQYLLAFGVLKASGIARKYGRIDTQRYSM